MKRFILSMVVFLAFMVLSVSIGYAQPGPPGGGPGCFPPPCDPIPIDGGLSYVLIAGLAFGGKKVYDLSKKA